MLTFDNCLSTSECYIFHRVIKMKLHNINPFILSFLKCIIYLRFIHCAACNSLILSLQTNNRCLFITAQVPEHWISFLCNSDASSVITSRHTMRSSFLPTISLHPVPKGSLPCSVFLWFDSPWGETERKNKMMQMGLVTYILYYPKDPAF